MHGTDRYARLPRNDAFHILRDDRRRAVLRYLATEQTDRPTPLSTLAAFVAAVVYDADEESKSVGEVQSRVRIALHHVHLPVLEDHGVVEYDDANRTVTPNPLLAALVPFLGDGLAADADLVVDTVAVERHGYHDAAPR
ncbi:DUF7344 domain-containing protein [Halogeometricum limi]|uniref:DUF7344 domain-containing protein n=1 Tax=Halogeometricum limi TaxID=555875 RepID=A0A1I6FZY2_9EURY|nr:hypothetical protein [Halogeometricum limi]SFR35451.1 hypothetical protein SAMN04488124_0620 [Halogeometricum limi]